MHFQAKDKDQNLFVDHNHSSEANHEVKEELPAGALYDDNGSASAPVKEFNVADNLLKNDKNVPCANSSAMPVVKVENQVSFFFFISWGTALLSVLSYFLYDWSEAVQISKRLSKELLCNEPKAVL